MNVRVPVRLQSGLAECGAACLAMVLSHHGRHTGVREVSEQCGVGRDGLSALAIVKAARGYGLTATAYKAETVTDAPLPAVAHWRRNHFVVVERQSARHVDVVDPAAGRRRLTREEFAEGYSGVLLTFEPGETFQPRKRARRTWVGPLARTALQKGLIARILLASLLLQILGLGVQTFSGILVDGVLPTKDSALLVSLGVALAVAGVVHLGLTYLRAATVLKLRLRADRLLTTEVVGHLFRLPYRYFATRGAGDLAQRSASVGRLRQLISGPITTALLDGPLAIGYVTIVLLSSVPLGLCLLALASVQAVLLLLTKRRRADLNLAALSAQVQTQGQLMEAIKGVEILKAGAIEDAALSRWSQLFLDQLKADGRQGRMENLVTSVLDSMRLAAPAALLWTGGWEVLAGRPLGQTLTLVALAGAALTPILSLVGTVRILQEAGTHLERLADILEFTPEPYGEVQVGHLRGQIELRDVSFRHSPNGPWILWKVSLTIGRGQKIALVGGSGSGKSTLARVMVGLYEPTFGAVSYDSVRMEALQRSSLRRNFGVVTQEAHLFTGTIRENIALGRPGATPQEIVRAAKTACVHDEIMAMPMGYETNLSEGMGLSGGQKQRLALARAVLGRPKVLLFDEATSHLDTVTEAAIERNLAALTQTRIVIAHRLSTVRDADLIAVIDEGRVVEQGTHDELLELDGHYARLVAHQENTPRSTKIPPSVACDS
ncbi:peptidase domain-containing ABC transporter [Herbidospora galbida]|uniref:Peptidase domain-containing ABC transporter n=1 Tax=Herbidospora galbida TaxID=2575442 RepID=A0A4U3MJB7_9ACTN|nr:peptidase domain-containing ABC transporter [Herbidospora galbida]TKK88096.1 peptidase domain-containing ABC transporter [Herbidospora galbida]